MNPSRFRFFVLASVVMAACGGVSKREAAEKLYLQGNDWYRSTKYNEAGTCYTRALQMLDLDYPEAAVGLGNVRREQCRIEAQRYIDNDPAKGINVSEVRKLYGDAEFYLRMADQMRPNYRDALYGLGLLYFEMATSKLVVRQLGAEQGERWLTASRERFEAAHRLNPAMGAPHEYLAQINARLSRIHEDRYELLEAIRCLEKVQESCDLFLAWFWQQPYRTLMPEEFDKRREQFELLKKEAGEGLLKLREEVGLAGTKAGGKTE